jgi:hypothetical protein
MINKLVSNKRDEKRSQFSAVALKHKTKDKKGQVCTEANLDDVLQRQHIVLFSLDELAHDVAEFARGRPNTYTSSIQIKSTI